jgi:hypothetical protein
MVAVPGLAATKGAAFLLATERVKLADAGPTPPARIAPAGPYGISFVAITYPRMRHIILDES